jgi:hypothetical protein
VLADRGNLNFDILSGGPKTGLRGFFLSRQKQRRTSSGCAFQDLPAVGLFLHCLSHTAEAKDF